MPWLRARLLAAVEDYARGITVDASALRDAMPQIDPANPEALREALADASLFQPEDTPQQKAALARLETLLALVEGWVATVVDDAAADRLPQAGALRRGDPAPPGHGRARRAHVRHPGRPGTAAAPAARGGRDLAAADRVRGARRAGTRCGRTRTCCPPPRTSTTRTGSWPGGPTLDMSALDSELDAELKAASGRRAPARMPRTARTARPASGPSGRWDLGGRAFGCWTSRAGGPGSAAGPRAADGRRPRAAVVSPACRVRCPQAVDGVAAGQARACWRGRGVHRDPPLYPPGLSALSPGLHGFIHRLVDAAGAA